MYVTVNFSISFLLSKQNNFLQMKAIILVTLLLVAFASASIYKVVPGESLKRDVAPEVRIFAKLDQKPT
jgi:hypothetical protein